MRTSQCIIRIAALFMCFAGPLIANATASNVDLSWTDNSDNETGFGIERRTGSSAYEAIGATEADVTTYTDNDLAPGTYVYRGYAFNDFVMSGFTNEVTTMIDSSPSDPTELKVTIRKKWRISKLWRWRNVKYHKSRS